jgi:hypothetical protein
MAAKIPPELHASVMKLAGEGKTSEDVAQWLWREHKIEISSRQVRSLIRKQRTELADVAKGVVREALRKELLPAVRRLALIGQRAAVLERRARKRAIGLREQHAQHPQAVNEDFLALKAMDRQMKSANLLMHYAGLNQPDKPGDRSQPLQDPRQALLKRIEELANKAASEPKTEPPIH